MDVDISVVLIGTREPEHHLLSYASKMGLMTLKSPTQKIFNKKHSLVGSTNFHPGCWIPPSWHS